MKRIWLWATLLGFGAALGLTQTTEELVNDGKNTENVTTQSMATTARTSARSSKSINRMLNAWCPSGARAL